MFWQENQVISENSLQILLKNKEGLQLSDVLADPFALQELRGGNESLITFLTEDTNLVAIVATALNPVISEEQPESEQYKLAHICSEILTVRNNDYLIDAFVECQAAIAVLKDSLNPDHTMNPLVASFFMKVMSHLLHKKFSKAMEIFENSHFVEKCLNNLQFGAISELLQNIIKIPSLPEEHNMLKQYLLKENFADRIVDLLNESQPTHVHKNAADLYIDLVKNIRDLLYSGDNPEDPFHDSLYNNEILQKLINILLNHGNDRNIHRSIAVNCAEILLVLLQTNSIMYCPSHLLESELLGDSWNGGNPGENLLETKRDMILPDREGRAEQEISSRITDIMNFAFEELVNNMDPDVVEKSDVWLYLLRLVAALCNTNNVVTHALLYQGFVDSKFKGIFDMVFDMPLCSILHSIIHRIISFVFYSNLDDTKSQLLGYFMEECDIFKYSLRGIILEQKRTKLEKASIRSFYAHIGLFILQSSQNSPSKKFILPYLTDNKDWDKLVLELEAFLDANRPDNNNHSETTNDNLADQMAVFDSINIQQKKTDFENSKCTKLLPNCVGLVLDCPRKTFPLLTSDPSRLNIIHVSGEEDFEKDFEDMCSARNIGIDDWPSQSGGMSDIWPSPKQDSSPNKSADTTTDAFPNWAPIGTALSEDDDWPGDAAPAFTNTSSSTTATGNSLPPAANDGWANFSPSNISSDWPNDSNESPRGSWIDNPFEGNPFATPPPPTQSGEVSTSESDC